MRFLNDKCEVKGDIESIRAFFRKEEGDGKRRTGVMSRFQGSHIFSVVREEYYNGCEVDPIPSPDYQAICSLFRREEEGVDGFIKSFRSSTDSKEAMRQVMRDVSNMYEELRRKSWWGDWCRFAVPSSSRDDSCGLFLECGPEDRGVRRPEGVASTSRAALLLSIAPDVLSYFSRD
jgi:hypothetical protein